jgi:hypothetical protein
MSENAHLHLFDPFFTTKGINGSGLGLWVSSEHSREAQLSWHLKSKRQILAAVRSFTSSSRFMLFTPTKVALPDRLTLTVFFLRRTEKRRAGATSGLLTIQPQSDKSSSD